MYIDHETVSQPSAIEFMHVNVIHCEMQLSKVASGGQCCLNLLSASPTQHTSTIQKYNYTNSFRLAP